MDVYGEDPIFKKRFKVPDYFDLNILNKLEQTLSSDELIQYTNYLIYETELKQYPVGLGEIFVLVNASGREKALALIKMIEQKNNEKKFDPVI